MVYGVGYLWFCMGIMASSPVLDSGYIPLRTKGIGCFLCAEFLNQCQFDGISDDVGICKEQPQYACLHHFSLVCEYHAGKDSLDAADKMRGNDCDILCGGIYCAY